VVEVKEIKWKSQLPKWENCKKNHVHVGVIRRKKSDRLIVVRHKIMLEIECADGYTVEMLDSKTLFYTGIFPLGDMICSKCGEFSTRINEGELCTDCLPKRGTS